MTQATSQPNQTAPNGSGTDLPTKYRPADHEPRIRKTWDDSGAFHADPIKVLSGEKPPYCIVIPPPNVTARLHLGHALNNTLQDILIRAHRMRGYETLWMPGTDHAGIATQTVVEQRILKEEGIRRVEMKREDFIARVQAWKDEYEAAISDQLQQMGCSCDWARQRFTMDDICARAVREAFFRLFKDGLIYRGKRLVNWDPVTQTALSDDEVEMEEIDGKFYYLRYPLVHPLAPSGAGVPPANTNHSPATWSELTARGYPGADAHPPEEPAWLTVATTRPETYLGDTAVAINPTDPRAASLEGLCAQLPLVGRILPIVQDDYVVLPDPESNDPKAQYATGFLKVTPAHDPNDWEIGQRHNLLVINIMAPDASISDKHGWSDVGDAHIFVGLSREDAREKVVAEFKSRGLLEQVKPYRHSVGHSYRSHAAIEPYLSDQWYCKVTDDRLRGFAQRALPADQRSTDTYPPQTSSPSSPSSPSFPSSPSGTGVPPVFSSSSPSSSSSSSSSSSGIPDTLTIHRRHLPHWQLGGSTYFITFRLASGELSPAERQLVLDACFHWHDQRATVRLVTVMPDHVHLILTPTMNGEDSWWPLEELMHSIKSFTAHQILEQRGISGPLWQDEYFDRLLRDADEFDEKWNYMLMNPVKTGLCEQPGDYGFTKKGEIDATDGGRDARPTGNSPTGERRDGEKGSGDGSMRFYPARYAQMYESWHDNLRDWCISRQLWWGHRIPVWRFELSIRPEIDKEMSESDKQALIIRQRIQEEHSDIAAVQNFRVMPDESGTGQERREKIAKKLGVSPETVSVSNQELAVYISLRVRGSQLERELEAAGYKQDPDVLDTWFSSALWPMSTMGWPEPDQSDQTKNLLGAFNPSSVLSTAREIITLWVSRMAMFNRYFMPPSPSGRGAGGEGFLNKTDTSVPGPIPFHHVYIHPVVQDGHGQRMSKSLGNGVDPLDIVHSHGSDAMRFVLCQMTTTTQDVRLPVDLVCPHCAHAFEAKFIVAEDSGKSVAAPEQTCPDCGKGMISPYGVNKGHAPTNEMPAALNTSSKFDAGRNFCTKLWNATRFAMMKLDGSHSSESCLAKDLSLTDRWMLSRLARAIDKIDSALSEYRFSEYAQIVYELVWWDFCDWYLEAIKPTIAADPKQQTVLRLTLDTILRLLHPITPFVTEVLYERLRSLPGMSNIEGLTLGASDLLCTAGWPAADASLIDDAAQQEFERLQAIVTTIRETRSAHKILPKRRITLHANAEIITLVESAGPIIPALAGLEAATSETAPEGSIQFLFEANACALSGLADEVDAEAEKNRLEEQLSKLASDISALQGRLNNPGYVKKAPPHLVEETKEQLSQKQAEREAAAKRLEAL